MRKLSRKSVVVVAVCMLFAIIMAVFLSPSISLLGAKAEEKVISSELKEEGSDVLSASSAEGVYTIKVTSDRTIVWMTESGKSLIAQGSTFSTITEMEVAFNPNKISLKEGYKFKCFTLEKGNLNKALTDLSQLEENKSYSIYPYFIKETGFVIDCLKEQDGEEWHEPLTKDYGDTMTLPTKSKTGYNFDGWYVMDDEYNRTHFTGTQFSIGSRFNYNKMPDLSVGKEQDGTHIKLEPRFTPIKVTISYVPYNGETIPVTTNVEYGSQVVLPIPGEREGYEFTGWCFSTTGSNGTGTPCTDSEGKMVNNWDKTANTTLYAKWEVVSYTITYVLNGGNWNNVSESDRPTSYTIETTTIILPTPIKTGYRFMGWYTNSSLTGTRVYSILKGSIGNKTFYAKWAKLYNIIYYNGSNPLKKEEAVSGEIIQLYEYNITGYTAVWTGNREAGSDFVVGNVDVMLKVVGWKAHTFNIKLYNNNQIRDDGSYSIYTVTYGQNYTLPEKSSAYNGYMFFGWFSKSGHKVTDIPQQRRFTRGDGKSLAVWNDDYGIDLIAEFIPKVVGGLDWYSRSNTYTITDSGDYSGGEDKINIKDYFGYSVSELYKSGYRTLCVAIQFDVWEKDDGYQWVILYDGNNVRLKDIRMEHGPGHKDSSSARYHIEFYIPITENMPDILYVRYGASGAFSDTWYNKEADVWFDAMVDVVNKDPKYQLM